mmetsp:Transcript_19537/g.46294  ORF Transcript_19537/g.46294 Transcript_19537/m.46294 type:complete len:348 (-) Transcript_19537:351-1394(-)
MRRCAGWARRQHAWRRRRARWRTRRAGTVAPRRRRASIVAWRRAGWVAPRRWGAAEPRRRAAPWWRRPIGRPRWRRACSGWQRRRRAQPGTYPALCLRFAPRRLGCQLSAANLRGTRRPAPAKLGHEARILVVHRHKAAGRTAAAGGVEERALGGSVAPRGGVNTLVVLLECAVDLRKLAHLLLLLCDGVVAVRVEDSLHKRLALLDALLVGPFNEHVHRLLVLGAEWLAIMPRTPVLDSTLAADHHLAARLAFHFLLCVAARPDDGAEEVVARVLFDGHDELAPTPLRHLGLERLDQRGPLAVQLLPPEHHAAIHTLAVFVEDGFWRRRALLRRNVAHAVVGKPQL